jgi:4a-hydroxytetrahydrobiopterin dehydratase
MGTLAGERLSALQGEGAEITDEEMVVLAGQVPDWRAIEREDVQQLERAFKFENFAQALAFTNRVGELAEAEDHHPAILTEWGKVTVTWWTHKVRGLHRNDFLMAAKTDRAYLIQSE